MIRGEAQARERLEEFDAKGGGRYGSIATAWERAWSEFVPFLAFPNEQAALKRIYLATLALDPSGSRPQALEQQVEESPQRVRPALRRPAYRQPGASQSEQQKATTPKGLKTPKS